VQKKISYNREDDKNNKIKNASLKKQGPQISSERKSYRAQPLRNGKLILKQI
jgi:hypothetical protein